MLAEPAEPIGTRRVLLSCGAGWRTRARRWPTSSIDPANRAGWLPRGSDWCGAGLPAPSRFDTRSGYVLSVCTDPEFRGRGFASAIMTSLLEWFTAAGITKVDLHASQFGVEIYRRLGFTEPKYPELTWRLPPS